MKNSLITVHLHEGERREGVGSNTLHVAMTSFYYDQPLYINGMALNSKDIERNMYFLGKDSITVSCFEGDEEVKIDDNRVIVYPTSIPLLEGADNMQWAVATLTSARMQLKQSNAFHVLQLLSSGALPLSIEDLPRCRIHVQKGVVTNFKRIPLKKLAYPMMVSKIIIYF